MSRVLLRILVLLFALTTVPASAQTRAWLDRAQVSYGETATLNIETTQSVQLIDYAPLRQQFDIAGQTVRRSFEMSNGRSVAKSLFAVGIRPRGPGVLTVPALRVGSATTAPLRMTVLPPSVQPASGDSDAFVETVVDADRPYVQQAVGVLVRLHYAVPLMSGQLDQDPPAGASLQRVGEDLQYQREIGGRRYNVVERRYLLIPERSGTLVLPGARFNGMTAGGFFDQVFDDGRKPLSAASPTRRLQVQPIPANAPQPWLPLHDLKLRYAQVPRQAKVGEAATVEIEVQADGASAAQLPQIGLAATDGVQVFADPPQSDEQFVDGRPTTSLRRRIALVPLKPGVLGIPGPRIEWWDAAQGVARTAMLPPIQLQVAPGTEPASASADPATSPAAAVGMDDAPMPSWRAWRRWLPWSLFGLAALAGVAAWWTVGRAGRPRAVAVDATPEAAAMPPAAPALADALKQGDLGGIAHALVASAGPGVGDLDAVRARLADAAQANAVAQLQAARWGAGDADGALAALRSAFARGAAWRRAERAGKPLLPPLYPGR